MKPGRLTTCLLLLFWACVVPRAPGQATTATAANASTTSTPLSDPGFRIVLEPTETRIGEPVTARLESGDPSVTPAHVADIHMDLDAESWHVDAPFRRQPASRDGKKAEHWGAMIRPFQTGDLAIPPLKVSWHDGAGRAGEAWTTTATLKVHNIRPAASQEWTLIPLRDPADIPYDWSWIWPALGLLLLCVLAAWAGVRWWCRRSGVAEAVLEPELPPGIWALRELDYRSRLPVCQNGPAKAIFSHVSEVIRLYLGRRYGVAAIDLTTYECMQALRAIQLGDEVMRWVREFLEECDVVKFTTHEPTRERWRTIWHDARLIVKMTTPPEELGESTAAEPAVREAVS